METKTTVNEDAAVIENTAEEKPVIPESGEERRANGADGVSAIMTELSEQSALIEELNIKLFDTKMRLALLLSGIAKEKLDESAALAAGLCKSGKTPEEAAVEITAAYPHLRAVQREMPRFAASGAGADDGFSAIRGVFAKR